MSDVTRSSADTVGNQEIDRNVESLNFIEIDLAEKTRTLWEGRKTIILVTAIFFGIGLFHYTFNPVEYQSTAVLIQEADGGTSFDGGGLRSEEHTSELQSRGQLVCRLLLEKTNACL